MHMIGWYRPGAGEAEPAHILSAFFEKKQGIRLVFCSRTFPPDLAQVNAVYLVTSSALGLFKSAADGPEFQRPPYWEFVIAEALDVAMPEKVYQIAWAAGLSICILTVCLGCESMVARTVKDMPSSNSHNKLRKYGNGRVSGRPRLPYVSTALKLSVWTF
ncbi:uncharacterized protein SETTUDRAFT_32093 [Exserohilum turcica Et28A]|uniref:Uncharacterized protein n=1 Tax=Exserohilum turcicum (strain 28A) TaxID=671987 RepID=R0K996_EXST2|nr:uncharacterized protein SETTUDRAFT_32093 [Exserohilum turcica Et28A]EOA84852.1 hypothetical protein SETTUDRAFT_32093 [Exserohilum turcica Et28A]